jgi:hypothetical protein
MSLTSKDIEEIKSKPFKEPRLTRTLLAVLRLLAKIPPIKNFIAESSGGISGRIFRCWDNKEYEKATQLAIHALEKYRNKTSRFMPFMDHHNWWQFMKHGVDSASHINDENLREKLVTYANAGIAPFEGYAVAYSYLEFSRWKYYAQNYDEAIKYAEVAAIADKTWAEPDFILGWYGLVLNMGKAEEKLIQAIEKDRKMLFRIVNNDVCKQNPHIINKLKAKYHTLKAVSDITTQNGQS